MLSFSTTTRRAHAANSQLARWHRWTAEHSLRVMGYASAFGQHLRLGSEFLNDLEIASLLHDIGKSVVPLSILNKPDRLDACEWDLMHEHPMIGAQIAHRFGCAPEVCAMIATHHEHWNGAGYPLRASASDIPLGGRIICIADVFDALTTPRSYRGPLCLDAALTLMDRESGAVLDPDLFHDFRRFAIKAVRGSRTFEAVDIGRSALLSA